MADDPLLRSARQYLQCKDPLNTKKRQLSAREIAIARERRKQEAAAQQIASFHRSSSLQEREYGYGAFKLPEQALDNVMALLVRSLEPGGVRGVSIVARELATAAQVSLDFYHASRAGFVALAAAIPHRLQQQLHGRPLPALPPAHFRTTQQTEQFALALALSKSRGACPSSVPHTLPTAAPATAPATPAASTLPAAAGPAAAAERASSPTEQPAARSPAASPAAAAGRSKKALSWQQWENLLTHPLDCSKPELVAAAGKLGLHHNTANTKTHPELVVWLLAAFGLRAPLPAAPVGEDGSRWWLVQVLRARALERCSPIVAWDGPDSCRALCQQLQALSSLGFRPAILAERLVAPDNNRSCLALARAELAAANIHNMAALTAALQEQRAAAAAAAAARRQRAEQRRAAAAAQQNSGKFRLDALKF